VGSLLVEPDEIVEQFVVKGIDVGKEQVFVELDEFFLDGAIKTFGMCVHLRAFGETGFELAAVI